MSDRTTPHGIPASQDADPPYSPFARRALAHLRDVQRLSKRNLEIWQLLLAKGYSNKEVARELHITEVTVKHHVKTGLQRLGVPNRVQALLKLQAVDDHQP